MQDAYDVAVIGGGIVGLLTAWQAGMSGKNTLLFEQHQVGKSEGSSKGSSRMFGESHEQDVYLQLARQSRYLWRELERETGQQLLHLNGGIDIAANPSSRKSVKEIAYRLHSRHCPFEALDGATLCRRYPQWRCSPSVHAIYSPNEGILRADRCMNAAFVSAKKYGVIMKDRTCVTSISPGKSGTVFVKTSSGETYRTLKLVIAAGPWSSDILDRFGVKLPLRVLQTQTVYFAPRRNAELFRPENFPVWEWEGSNFVYGFPMFEEDGLKVAFHGGRYLRSLSEFKQTPNRDLIKRLRLFLHKCLPDAAGEDFGATTCLYTNTPDDDFVVDVIPGFPQIAYFAGCSGHAFHCAPAVGKTLVELVSKGKTEIDISRFSAKRFR